MIDQRKLKELIKLMVDNDLTELDLNDEKESVTLKRAVGQPPVMQSVAAPQLASVAPAAPQDAAPPAEPDADAGLVPIASPMVGTFYSAQSPDADAFVNVGDAVEPETVACIIEAMKVFNEIRAEVKGTIARVLVEDGQAVEFGQPLYLVKPS
jgi:acetyl-CoA carboxylase biotin carboxyl carrier protein